MEDRDYLSFREFLNGLKVYNGSSRDYYYLHNGIVYGKNIDYRTMAIYHKASGTMKKIASSNSKNQFRPILIKFINYIVEIDKYKNKILNYTDNEKFKVYNDQEYKIKISQMKNPLTFRDTSFIIDGKQYHMATNVKIADQMLYCCNIIDIKDLDNWYFSIKLNMRKSIDDLIEMELYFQDLLDEELNFQELSDEELKYEYSKERLKKKSNKIKSTVNKYERSKIVSEIAKRRANGICELSLKDKKHTGPFEINGRLYLEAHHIVWLSRGGEDDIDNVVALCPNCHKKMHMVDNADDIIFLEKRIKYYKGKRLDD